jgi:hypothetical protein
MSLAAPAAPLLAPAAPIVAPAPALITTAATALVAPIPVTTATALVTLIPVTTATALVAALLVTTVLVTTVLVTTVLVTPATALVAPATHPVPQAAPLAAPTASARSFSAPAAFAALLVLVVLAAYRAGATVEHPVGAVPDAVAHLVEPVARCRDGCVTPGLDEPASQLVRQFGQFGVLLDHTGELLHERPRVGRDAFAGQQAADCDRQS